ncbi:MAG TPA: hypothetical protein VGU64_20270, partial [Terriglobales bacterium]|nr:hypothetical protein [Terriglobales bacterium]
DVALARIVKSSGRRIFFRYGKDVVRTRMYRNFSQLCEGWTKNLTLLFPSPRRLALLRLLEFVLILASAVLAVIETISGRTNSAVVLATITVVLYAFFLARIRRAHFSWQANAVALLGLPLFAYLLQRSELFNRQAAVSWKGRAYNTRLAEQEPERHSAASAHAANAHVSKPLSALTPAASDRNNSGLHH